MFPSTRAACVIALSGLIALAALPPVTADVEFTLLHMNDVHARIQGADWSFGECSTWMDENGSCFGGFARMKTIIDREREAGDVLVLNAGDDSVGTNWHQWYKGDASAHFNNMLGIDAYVLGNHDFDSGPDQAANFVKALEYPVVSCNMNANGHWIEGQVSPYVILPVGSSGAEVGIIGVTTKVTNEWSQPGPVYFEDERPCIQQSIKELNDKGINIIILLSHSGYNADRFHAREVWGLDMVVGGHSHSLLAEDGAAPTLSWKENGDRVFDEPWGSYPTWEDGPDGTRVTVLQAGWASRYMGRLKLRFSDDGRLLNAEGAPILLGGSKSSNDVPRDWKVVEEAKKWCQWDQCK